MTDLNDKLIKAKSDRLKFEEFFFGSLLALIIAIIYICYIRRFIPSDEK